MNIQREKLRCMPMGAAAYFGGDSSSSTTNQTQITDSRVVGGNDAVNLSAFESSVNVSTTDRGAVAGGLALGTQAISAATQNATNTLATSENMFAGALGTFENLLTTTIGAINNNSQAALGTINSNSSAAIGAAGDAAGMLGDAYQSGQAGDQTQLKYAGFVVVGLAAAMLLPRLLKA